MSFTAIAEREKTLYFTQFMAAQGEFNTYIVGNAIIYELLLGSGLQLCPKHLPIGFRHIAEIKREKLDITFILVNQAQLGKIAAADIEVIPYKIVDIHEYYYKLKESDISYNDISQHGDYRIGYARDISPWKNTFFEKSSNKFESYSDHVVLLKALLVKRVDLVNGIEFHIALAKKNLAGSAEIVKLGISQTRALYLGIRATLSEEIKAVLRNTIKINAPSFIDQGGFDAVLEKYRSREKTALIDSSCSAGS